MSDKEERPLPGALPCPFCGGTKITTYPGSTFRWRYAACDECGAQAEEIRIETISLPRPEAIAEADKDLLKAWNKRAPLPESQPLSGATLDRNTLLEAARIANKKSHDPKDYTDQVEDYEFWRGYAHGREDVATELRALTAVKERK